jgi:hypothetical protein
VKEATILLLATVVNALAAALSTGMVLYSWKVTRADLREQQRVQAAEREAAKVARLEQERVQAIEREAARFEKLIASRLGGYLDSLSTDWYRAVEQGVSNLDELVKNRADRHEIRTYVRSLTFSLREIWRRASFNLIAGAESWSEALVRELERAHEELEDEINRALLEHASQERIGRGPPSTIFTALRKHSVDVLGSIKRHTPDPDASVRHPAPAAAPRRGR